MMISQPLLCFLSTVLAARVETIDWPCPEDDKDCGENSRHPCDDKSISVQPASEDDKKIISKLFEVKCPEQIGVLSQKKRGKDKIAEEKWTGIEIENVWQIRQETKLAFYKELLKKESNSTIPFVIRTAEANNAATEEARSKGKLSERELLLMHGSNVAALKSIVCTGFHPPRKTGSFGKGVYLTDQIEKSDQYAPDCMDGNDMSEAGGSEDSCLKLGLVVRANMGRTVQVQRELLCTSDTATRKNHIISHWVDPSGGQKDEKIIWEIKNNGDSPGNFTGAPPYEEWDSIQVIATMQNQSFSENWSKLCEYTKLSNTFPWRFNEYVMQHSADPVSTRMVAEYLVSYRRVNNNRSQSQCPQCIDCGA